MSALHLVRLRLRTPEFVRFAKEQGLLHVTEAGSGYALHAWLAAMFGQMAPKPFRFDPRRAELLGYASMTAEGLADHAQAFASPLAYAALHHDSLLSKPMPAKWTIGRSLRLDVEVCPVSRVDGDEKDVYLRALDRLGDGAPARETVYRDWLRKQLESAVVVQSVEIASLAQREGLVRPDRAASGRRLRIVERPRVQCIVQSEVRDSQAFAQLLSRGVGRHSAFGFGMLLLAAGS